MKTNGEHTQTTPAPTPFSAALAWMLERLEWGGKAEFARKVNISQGYLSELISGRKEGREQTREQMAEALGLSYEAFKYLGQLLLSGVPGEEALEEARRTVWGTGNVTLPAMQIRAKGHVVQPVANTEPVPLPERSRRVPLISFVLASNWGEVVDGFEPGDAEAWIECASRVGPRAFALQVKGPSMEPEFREGEVIVVDPDIEAQSGDYVVAKNGDEEATFKRYLKDGDKHYLCPLNDRFQMMDMTDRPWRIVAAEARKFAAADSLSKT